MASAEALYQKLISANTYGNYASTTQAVRLHEAYEQRREYEMQQQWHQAKTYAATTTSGATAMNSIWNDNSVYYVAGNQPGQMMPLPARLVAPAAQKPKEPTNLQWLDKRVDEMRVRL